MHIRQRTPCLHARMKRWQNTHAEQLATTYRHASAPGACLSAVAAAAFRHSAMTLLSVMRSPLSEEVATALCKPARERTSRSPVLLTMSSRPDRCCASFSDSRAHSAPRARSLPPCANARRSSADGTMLLGRSAALRRSQASTKSTLRPCRLGLRPASCRRIINAHWYPVLQRAPRLCAALER